MKLDPIALQILWQRLITVMDEVDSALVRTAFSTIVGETRDFACTILDHEACSLAQSQLSSPAFTCSLPKAARHLLEVFAPATLRPGDVLITNDPWLAHGHKPDVVLVSPLFVAGRPVAYLATVAHVADIGGRTDELVARDMYEEGLLIPPARLFEQGERNELLFDIIANNVRAPKLVIGDLLAIVGSQHLGAQRFAELVEDYSVEAFAAAGRQILTLSEQSMRDAIRAVPDGRYHHVVKADGFGEPLIVAVTVTVAGDAIEVDMDGSSPAYVDISINCVLNVTHAHAIYPLKCALLPHLPNNEGLFRPITVKAPVGSVFNARKPAPVKARSKASYHIHNAIFGALASVLPAQVQAGSGSFWSLHCYGEDADDEPFNIHVLPNGGKGAVSSKDGYGTIAFPANGTITPAEIIENASPLLVLERALLEDSGGPGQQRGGLGQRLRFGRLGTTDMRVSVRPDKIRFPAPGLEGGLAGAAGRLLLNDAPVAPDPHFFEPGSVLMLELPGGGGFGDPATRAPDALRRDVIEGYVSRKAARLVYGATLSDRDEVKA